MDNTCVLEMKGISKAFNGVKVLTDVSFDLHKGEVHALVGANGAGKSTLMRILNGIYTNYEGTISLCKQGAIAPKNPRDALEHGIAMIHQELDLVYNLNVSENIFLGREKMHGRFISALDRKAMNLEAQALLDSLKFDICATDVVSTLPPAKQQLVLIARVVALNAQVVVMDEPTSSLSINEIENLFTVIHDLCKKGISVIYISHFLEEIFRIADRVTVLRNGGCVTTVAIQDCCKEQIIEWMVGRKAEAVGTRRRCSATDEVILDVNGLTQKNGIVKDVTFNLRKGEILGIAGVVGSGRTELGKMLYGAERVKRGSVSLYGQKVQIKLPAKAVACGMALVPENRKEEGLILIRTINQNIALTGLKHYCRSGVIHYSKISEAVESIIRFLSIRCTSQEQETRFLSGGNQQKVVIGKWLSNNSKIIIMDQPTRGVDVGAKEEIYEFINTLVDRGTTIILISDEMEEILNLSDRILVMKRGEIVREFENQEKTLHKTELLAAMVSDTECSVAI